MNLGNNRILVIEDDNDVASLLAYRLGTQGYQVFRAERGSEVILAIRKFTPALIILDLMLPDLDGFQICSLLKAAPQTRSIPIVVVTALNDDVSRDKALRAGADRFIGKHGFLKAVASAVDQLLCNPSPVRHASDTIQ